MIFLILIGLVLVGISGFSSYAIFTSEVTSPNEIRGVVTKKISGADMLIDKVGTGGLVAVEHPATTQLQATSDYRYIGSTPNNYIKFNGEVWRIIGIFDTDDGTGKFEKRIKIIRDTSIGYSTWGNSSGNWSTASLMTLLNSGAYYNRTGTYASTGLTEEAKSQIADAKWYLGGFESASLPSIAPSSFYNYERNTSSNWVGKVGLMYVSDYGYATSGGKTYTKEACINMTSWNNYGGKECINNDWLFNGSVNKWTIVHDSSLGGYALYISNGGTIITTTKTSGNNSVFPSIYLKSDIKIVKGEGTTSNPYEVG